MDTASFDDLDLVLVCGLPGAGKDRFCAERLRGGGRRRVARRDIRRALWEMTSFGVPWSEDRWSAVDEGLVKHVEREIVEHLLRQRLAVVVENTCVTAASRRAYVEAALRTRRRAGVVWLDTPPATCLARNRRRAGPVPERVIAELAAALEPPGPAEGFTRVARVTGG